VPGLPYCIVFSPDNQLVVISCRRGEMEAGSRWSRKLWSNQYHAMGASALAISLDLRFLGAASRDPQVTLWDLQKGTLIAPIQGALNSLQFRWPFHETAGVCSQVASRPRWTSGHSTLQNVGTFKCTVSTCGGRPRHPLGG